MSVVLFALVAMVLLAGGCGDKQEEAAPQQGKAPPQGAHGRQDSGQKRPGRGDRGPAEQALPVAVQPASSGSIASYYNATATLEAEKEAQVLARVSGTVASIPAEEGDRVGDGAALLHIRNDEYRLRLQQAEARTANVASRYTRLQSMLAEELISQEEFQAVESEMAIAEAEEGLAALNLSYTTVTAPFAGRVTGRLVDSGQNVSAGTPLFVMADFEPLLARVHVPSREFNKLTRDQAVDLVLDSNGQRLQGRITLISPIIDPSSGTIKITVEVPQYPPDTRPGDFAEVQIVTERHDETTLVPRAAVITDKGETLVYVASPAEEGEDGIVAERRVVELGFTDDEHAEILAGLAVGEKVVVKGQRSLKPGALLKILADPGEGAGS